MGEVLRVDGLDVLGVHVHQVRVLLNRFLEKYVGYLYLPFSTFINVYYLMKEK